MEYRDIEWFALEINRDYSVIFEIASKYSISDSFVDYDGYSISSKGLAHSCEHNGHLSLIQMTFISTSVGKNPLEEME